MTRTRIKICGLTREADVAAACDAGADALGFVMWPGSPRHVSLERAVSLVEAMPPFMTPVLLFVNATAETVTQAVRAMPQALLQFHGDESPEACRSSGQPWLRAARIRPGFDLLDFATRYVGARALLLDAHVESYGGSGEVFDWSLIPTAVPVPLVLSGGLNPANVSDGIACVRPWAVDVSSGVEVGKGVKDALLMRRFCQAVRSADDRLAT